MQSNVLRAKGWGQKPPGPARFLMRDRPAEVGRAVTGAGGSGPGAACCRGPFGLGGGARSPGRSMGREAPPEDQAYVAAVIASSASCPSCPRIMLHAKPSRRRSAAWSTKPGPRRNLLPSVPTSETFVNLRSCVRRPGVIARIQVPRRRPWVASVDCPECPLVAAERPHVGRTDTSFHRWL